MGTETKIAWCDHTFNPWIGCSKVHAGCANCYAEADMDKRRGRAKWGPQGTRSVTSSKNWTEPLKWDRAVSPGQRRPRVFCASLADVFEDWTGPMLDHEGRQLFVDGDTWFTPGKDCMAVSARLTMADCRAALFDLIDRTPNLDWLLLTKRPENIRRMWPAVEGGASPRRENVWLGTSISDQATADRMVPDLLPNEDLASVLFVSAEPLLGPVDLTGWLYDAEPAAPNPKIDWVIPGGESGPHARPCDVAWVRSLVEQCRAANVACHVKQLGARPYDSEWHGDGTPKGSAMLLNDRKGGDPAEWPAGLRVRDWP